MNEQNLRMDSSFRPIRIALVNFGPEESTSRFRALLTTLGVKVFSEKTLGEVAMEDYDLVGLTGNIEIGRLPREWENTLAFQPSSGFQEARGLLRRVDSVILCEDEVAQVISHFFESLLVPSLLNIDLSDVTNMARGIGLSFHVSGKDGGEVVSRLPSRSYLAKSALLHFSCTDDVTLKEVYQISQTIARSRDDQAKIRKINVKIGLRIETRASGARINLTAILFGI